ncbi:MAG TPA: hypothetical protein VHF51_12855 [Solirubrobacteraceae bacterium]|nr:hypothetical protein [Solirubrobacteraceae bacterium]
MSLTIAWAALPEDGAQHDALLRVADRRLHRVKDARPAPAAG